VRRRNIQNKTDHRLAQQEQREYINRSSSTTISTHLAVLGNHNVKLLNTHSKRSNVTCISNYNCLSNCIL